MPDPFPLGVDALRAGLPWLYRIETTSMVPVLRPGDVAEVRPCKAADLVPGDIACVDTPDGPLLHRVVRVGGEPGSSHVLTRGDRSRRIDRPHEQRCILGRVAWVRWFGQPIRLDAEPGRTAGRLAALGWPLARAARHLLTARQALGTPRRPSER